MVEIGHGRFQPRTSRQIGRIGRPIPFPTTYEELVEQLDWALGELHRIQHAPNLGKPGYMPDDGTVESAGSDYCRMRYALKDERFKCPDEWHLRYQPASKDQRGGVCPTCELDWIAVQRVWL